MKNKYGLPRDALQRIFERDQACVYCRKIMHEHDPSKHPGRRDWYTIEHLDEAATIFNARQWLRSVAGVSPAGAL